MFHPCAHVLLIEHTERFHSYGTGERIGHERRPVHQHTGLAVRYGVGYIAARQHGAHCHISGRETLADTHYIRLHAGPFPGEFAPGAPETSGDLVKYKQYAEFVAQSAQLAQILRVIKPHAARSLHDRLQDKGSQLGPVLFK